MNIKDLKTSFKEAYINHQTIVNRLECAESVHLVREFHCTKVTRMMFIKHYAPNRCLCIKVAKLITGLRIAEMSQLQNCSVMCTKNGSYCENEKKERRGEGECVQRMEVIVKRTKSQGGGQGRCERRS